MRIRRSRFIRFLKWSLLAFGVLLAVLCGPVATWLQSKELHDTQDSPDAVYILSGERHSHLRDQGFEEYLRTLPERADVTILLGMSDTVGRWSPEHQRNLLVHEWRQIEINRILKESGRPALKVLLVPGTYTGTDGEMEALAAYLEDQSSIGTLALLSSSFHLRRSHTRLKAYLQRDLSLFLIPAASWEDRMPWTVALELGKMLRDKLGWSRVPLLSREKA